MPDNYVSSIDFGDGILRTFKADGSGSGLYIGDVNNLTTTSTMGVQKITLTWDDPDDIYIDGALQASWGGTKIVRKEGSVPATIADGTIIVDNTVRNQYSSVGFEDNTIALDTVYYYRAFTYTTNNTYTEGSYVSDEVQSLKVYGVEWDGTASSAWTRTDGAAELEDPIPYYPGIESTPSSPFDSVLPWSGMQVVEDAEAGTLVSIPKFYYKWTASGSTLKLQISSIKIDDSWSTSPAHIDREDGQGERDIVYVGRYNCKNNTLESATNSAPYYRSTTINEARSVISAKGAEIWQWDYALYWTICMLYLVEYADWDSQAKIGIGSEGLEYSGGTDQMPYHTGSISAPGVSGVMQYRHIENLWRYSYGTYCDGILFKRAGGSSTGYRRKIYIIKNPTNFNNSDTTNAVFIGNTLNYSGFIRGFSIPEVAGFEWALYVSNVYQSTAANYNSYVRDYYESYDASQSASKNLNALIVCGGGTGDRPGLFSRRNNVTASSEYNTMARLMKLPNNT